MRDIDMGKKVSARIAAVVLFIHGFIETLAVLMPFIPEELLPAKFFGERLGFWLALGVIFGLSRLIAGYAVWSMKKWGIAFGVALSITTMIVAPSIYPFGIMDLILALVVLVSLIYLWFGSERL